MLNRIRQRDSAIYDSNTKLYDEESTDDDEAPDFAEKEKRTYLKDVLARQVGSFGCLPIGCAQGTFLIKGAPGN